MENLPLIAGTVIFAAAMIGVVWLCIRGWLARDLPTDPYADALGKDGER